MSAPAAALALPADPTPGTSGPAPPAHPPPGAPPEGTPFQGALEAESARTATAEGHHEARREAAPAHTPHGDPQLLGAAATATAQLLADPVGAIRDAAPAVAPDEPATPPREPVAATKLPAATAGAPGAKPPTADHGAGASTEPVTPDAGPGSEAAAPGLQSDGSQPQSQAGRGPAAAGATQAAPRPAGAPASTRRAGGVGMTHAAPRPAGAPASTRPAGGLASVEPRTGPSRGTTPSAVTVAGPAAQGTGAASQAVQAAAAHRQPAAPSPAANDAGSPAGTSTPGPTALPGAAAPPAGSGGSGAAAQAAAPGYGVDLQQTVEALHGTIALAARSGLAQARIALHPAELGEVLVHLTQTARGLLARVTADTAAATQALAAAHAELRHSLSFLGIDLARLDIGRHAPSGTPGGSEGGATHDRAGGRNGDSSRGLVSSGFGRDGSFAPGGHAAPSAGGRASNPSATPAAPALTDPDLADAPTPLPHPRGALVDVLA